MKLDYISRIAEELFPFPYYIARSRRLLNRCAVEDIVDSKEFSDFMTLSVDQLKHRLEEEHRRATTMDEKTFKLTLSLSVALTVLGSLVAFVTDSITSGAIQATLMALFGVGLFYVLAAGLTAVGALRTRRLYGYGTRFLLQQQGTADARKVIADALVRQETMNIVRHLRNETAYQALRNGLLMLFVGISIFSVALVYQSFDARRASQAVHVGHCAESSRLPTGSLKTACFRECPTPSRSVCSHVTCDPELPTSSEQSEPDESGVVSQHESLHQVGGPQTSLYGRSFGMGPRSQGAVGYKSS